MCFLVVVCSLHANCLIVLIILPMYLLDYVSHDLLHGPISSLITIFEHANLINLLYAVAIQSTILYFVLYVHGCTLLNVTPHSSTCSYFFLFINGEHIGNSTYHICISFYTCMFIQLFTCNAPFSYLTFIFSFLFKWRTY